MDDTNRNDNGCDRRRDSDIDDCDGGVSRDSRASMQASWFQISDWFTFEDAVILMRCSPSTLKKWIRGCEVVATFPPGTDGNALWLVHKQDVMNPPERNPPWGTK